MGEFSVCSSCNTSTLVSAFLKGSQEIPNHYTTESSCLKVGTVCKHYDVNTTFPRPKLRLCTSSDDLLKNTARDFAHHTSQLLLGQSFTGVCCPPPRLLADNLLKCGQEGQVGIGAPQKAIFHYSQSSANAGPPQADSCPRGTFVPALLRGCFLRSTTLFHAAKLGAERHLREEVSGPLLCI